MIQITDKKECTGCFACLNICPQQCILMKQDIEGFLYPSVNITKCIQCGLCESICPVKKKLSPPIKSLRQTFVGYCKEEVIRLQSSSGGIFSILALEVIKQGGVVFGAAFDNNFLVYHIPIFTKEELKKIQGSKYVQSRIEDTFRKAKEYLVQGKKVLFSGTSCQIAGLKSFLKKEYINLITVDLLCHGVPSPKLWKQYLKKIQVDYSDHIQSINFRSKVSGWHEYSVQVTLDDLKKWQCRHNDDIYIQLFIHNLCLRPSCYNCQFKKMDRFADITLGDCWSIQNCYPELDDNKGTSIIVIHTMRGMDMFYKIQSKLCVKKVPLNYVLSPTDDSRRSVEEHPKRKKFFRDLVKGREIDYLALYLEADKKARVKKWLKLKIKDILKR